MIVYTKDDTVKLSGALVRNQWPTIKAAAMVLLKQHPEGILIDGGELTNVTEDGSRTFLDAVKEIESAGARIVVCNLPASVRDLLATIPGVRSQIAMSMSVDEARDSLRSGSSCSDVIPGGAVIVPLLEGTDPEASIRLGAALARDRGLPFGMVAFIVIPRQLPLSAPQPEAEAEARERAAQGSDIARKMGIPCALHLERTRETRDGLISFLSQVHARMVALALTTTEPDMQDQLDLADLMLRKAPCGVLIARLIEGNGASSGSERTTGLNR